MLQRQNAFIMSDDEPCPKRSKSDVEGQQPQLDEESDFDMEAELAALIGDEAGAIVIDDNQEQSEADAWAKVAFLIKLAIVITAAMFKIEENAYTFELREKLSMLITNTKILQSYYEQHQPEDSPPHDIRELYDSWARIKPLAVRMGEPESTQTT